MSDIELLNILNINCNTIGTDKEEKGENWNMRKNSILGAGIEYCCANTGLERICVKTNSNTSCYTDIGSNSHLNNRPADVIRPVANNNENKCSIPGPNTETNRNNHGNSYFNNRPNLPPLSNKNDIKYFLPDASKDSDKKASALIKNSYKRNLKMCLLVTVSVPAKLSNK